MRLIDANSLMPLFVEKAHTMKDRHGIEAGEDWLLNYFDIKDVVDNAPTVDAYTREQVNWILKQLGVEDELEETDNED